jgi:hypothetical protein
MIYDRFFLRSRFWDRSSLVLVQRGWVRVSVILDNIFISAGLTRIQNIRFKWNASDIWDIYGCEYDERYLWPVVQCGLYSAFTKNGAVSKVNNKFISHVTRITRTPSVAATVQVSHVLRAVRFSCLLRGRGASFQDGVAAGKGFLCALFWGVQVCDYSAAWVLCTV